VGYIGSVACQTLLASGADVLALDNLERGHREAIFKDIEFHRVDVADEAALLAALTSFRPDAVLHFAALTIAPESVRHPELYWRVNTGGTLSLLNAMRDAGVKRLVFSSTAAVYGTPREVPIREDARLAPINPYGASKLAAEMMIESFGSAHGLTFAMLRYFNVAGAAGKIGEDHTPETHLIPSALDAAAGRRPPLDVYGTDFPTPDGTAIRDYVHVEDLIDAHVLALHRLLDENQTLGAINLGTRDGASVMEVMAAVERVTGTLVPHHLAHRREGDPAILVADPSRAESVLGWTPRRSSLDEMVSSAWDWRRRFPNGYGTA
jgi:UDP-glucose 4-epimerase